MSAAQPPPPYALPPGYAPHPQSPYWQYRPPGDQRPGSPGRTVLLWFGLVLLLVLAIGAAVVWLLQPGPVQAECPDPLEACGAPPARPEPDVGREPDVDPDAAPALRLGETWQSDDLGFSLDYDPDWWEVVGEGDRSLELVIPARAGPVTFLIEGASSAEQSPESMLAEQVDALDGLVLGLTPEDDTDQQLLGQPIVGYRDGVGGLYGGTLDSPQGPSMDVAVAVLAASDGEISLLVTVVSPEEIREPAFVMADSLLNTLRWPSDE